MASKHGNILGGIPGGGLLIDQQPTREYELLTFTDGDTTVYAGRAWVGGRDGGLMTDGSGAPLQSPSAALIRLFLAAQGWAERVPVASVAAGVRAAGATVGAG